MIANIDAAFLLFTLSTVPKIVIGYIVSRLHDIEKPMTVAASLLSLDIETLVVLIIAIDLGVISEQMLQIFAPAVLFSTLTIIILYTVLDRE